MSHVVLAVGVTALCLAGSAWYLPAVADLRAGDDRPRSRRLAARACLTGWAATAAAGLLLFVPAPWQVPWEALCAVAGGGAATTAVLRVRARTHLVRERREADACWTALRGTPPAPDTATARRGFLALALLGTVAASGLAAALLLLTDAVTAVLASVSVAGAALLAAAVHAAGPGRRNGLAGPERQGNEPVGPKGGTPGRCRERTAEGPWKGSRPGTRPSEGRLR
ncbi:hypothetical protein [Streptomyces sp. NPDC008001]|uniref:hypothetical protein n=1 Tax=Streptomyces sp. NPDC008001 TaxID=3364804 RepID=UPI0036E306B8